MVVFLMPYPEVEIGRLPRSGIVVRCRGNGPNSAMIKFIPDLSPKDRHSQGLVQFSLRGMKPGVGIEPTTSSLPMTCSNQLSYPGNIHFWTGRDSATSKFPDGNFSQPAPRCA